MILCPCRVCMNSFWRDASEIREHLICDGFLKGYRTWTLYGEEGSSCMNHGSGDIPEVIEQGDMEDIHEFLRDLACCLDDRGDMEDDGSFQPPNNNLAAIHKLAMHNS
ncbi:hypothetical protein PR202_gb20510 [Eleusine coracana subsp. coracana]|uniref:Transposase-associated domain-containing protein n=1 Tax=Eleusine coracana subsp. coracana TaxID=191504 RepID=A0AAV5F8P9_ELECO|nr:hypothetical protein PR202_gb20510 [Eleusine coracana subsp. coracana]